MLVAAEHLHEEIFAVGRPGDVGQVALLVEVIGLQGREDVAVVIANAQGNLLGGHPGHRVADQLRAAGAAGDVIERIERDGGFVLAVDGQAPPVRGGKDAAVDAEFVAAHRLAVDDAGPFGLRQLPRRRFGLRPFFGQLAVGRPEQRDPFRGDGMLALADGLGHGQEPGFGIVGRVRRKHPGHQQDQGSVHIASPPVKMGISVVSSAGEMEMMRSTT